MDDEKKVYISEISPIYRGRDTKKDSKNCPKNDNGGLIQKSLTPQSEGDLNGKVLSPIISYNGNTVNTVNTLNLEKIKIIKKELRRWLSIIEVDYRRWQKVGEPDIYSTDWLSSHFESEGICGKKLIGTGGFS